ncbi:MAG: hypothetical protein A2Y86_08270 [Candidatus Aminicenantes bacterium RBG_13_62_12]|nr:MAG: hypothetical protein A2Y86_08270 [Candidatus Aminicenantes bacterium RBG_13_62_12]
MGIYLMKMGRETPFPEIAARNSGEEAQIAIVKGRYFIQVDNLGDVPASRAEAVALANAFLAGVAEESALTPLDALPAEGKVPGSERLVRGPYGLQPYFTFGEGDILSLGGRIFGALANYREGPDAVSLRFIIPYAGEAQTGSVYDNLLANLDPYLKVLGTRQGAFVFEDHREKFGIVERKGPNLDIRVNLDLRPKL